MVLKNPILATTFISWATLSHSTGLLFSVDWWISTKFGRFNRICPQICGFETQKMAISTIFCCSIRFLQLYFLFLLTYFCSTLKDNAFILLICKFNNPRCTRSKTIIDHSKLFWLIYHGTGGQKLLYFELLQHDLFLY